MVTVVVENTNTGARESIRCVTVDTARAVVAQLAGITGRRITCEELALVIAHR